MQVRRATQLFLAIATASLMAPPAWGGASVPGAGAVVSPPGETVASLPEAYPLPAGPANTACRSGEAPGEAPGDRYAQRLAESSLCIARSFMAPEDSVRIYCSRAERILLEIEPAGPDDPDLLVRLGIVNGRLAEFCSKGEKVERVRRMERYCREAIAQDSTASDAYLLLGTLHYRLCRLSWLERMLAKAFVGELPDASLEEAEAFLRRAIELEGGSPVALYVLGRTLDAQNRLQEAIDCLEACLELEPANPLDAHYQQEATIHLPELEREWMAIEEPWNVIDGY